MGRVVLGPRKIYQNVGKGLVIWFWHMEEALLSLMPGVKSVGNWISSRLLLVYDYQARSRQLWFKWRSFLLSKKEAASSNLEDGRLALQIITRCGDALTLHISQYHHHCILLLLHYWVPLQLSYCLAVFVLFYFLVTRAVFNDFSSSLACRALNPRRKTKTTVEAFQIWPVQGLGRESHSRISYKTIWIKGVLQVKECTSKVKTSNHMCAQA